MMLSAVYLATMVVMVMMMMVVASTEDCPLHCPPVDSPVCGTDDQNYQNVCRLLQSSCLHGLDVQLRHVGKCGVPEPCPLFCPHTGEPQFCGDNLKTYPSMCHVQAEICRGVGPNYVTQGGCQPVKTLIQKALNAGSTLSTDRQSAYIDSSCGAERGEKTNHGIS